MPSQDARRARAHGYRAGEHSLHMAGKAVDIRLPDVSKPRLRDAALDAGILERAKAGAERAITGLLTSSGYDEVVIRWK